MKFGLKLWSHNVGAYYEEATRLFRQNLIDYIELYIAPDTLSHIPQWHKLGSPFTIHCAHSTHGFNLANASQLPQNLRLFNEARQYADALNADFIIIHGGIGGDAHETARQFTTLAETRAIIENKPYRPIPGMGHHESCRGYNKSELEIIMSTASCGFCLDFVHAVCAANSQKLDIYEYIADLMSLNPCMFHLSNMTDITSEYDSHIHLENGALQLSKLISALPSNAKITLETEKESKTSLADFESDVLYAKKFDISLRPAKESDLISLYNLKNDELVIKNSFTQRGIELLEHQNWFKKVLHSKDTLIYIIENALAEFVGQIRFDAQSKEQYLMSIALVEKYRGLSLASALITKAMQAFSLKKGIIKAEIMPTNKSSVASFERAGFILSETLADKLIYIKEQI